MRHWKAAWTATLVMAMTVGQAASLSSEVSAASHDSSWIELFDGESLLGWSVENEGVFEVEDGVIRLVDGFGWLRSEQRYRDFILELDARPLEDGFDSGVYFRAGLEGDPWPEREYQVNTRFNRYGWLVQGSTALVEGTGLYIDPEQWHTIRLHVEEDRATLWIDDEQQWETDGLEVIPGYIGFQAEGKPFEFRNIRIREIGYVDLLSGDGPLGDYLTVHAGPEDWRITEDGILLCDGEEGGGWIGTKTGDYGDFSLKFDFNVPEDGNSGVFVHFSPDHGLNTHGMEIQLIDDDTKRWGDLEDWQLTGAVYRFEPPAVRATREAGTWQSMQIVHRDGHFQVFTNGIPVIDIQLDDYDEPINGWEPLKGRPRAGFIGFQNYDGRMAFRNMRIKRLD